MTLLPNQYEHRPECIDRATCEGMLRARDEAVYAMAREIARLRAELKGTAALLRDAEAEVLRLRDAINRLTLAAGGTLVTDGDTTCTLGWWAARVLEGDGKGVTE